MFKHAVFAFFLATVALWVSLPASAQEQSYRDQVQLMYVAYYGRPGDNGGLDFWAGQLESNGGDLRNIINAFGDSAEFLDRYGDLGSEDLVNNVFQQLFNRDADPAGLAFYTGKLDAGELTLGSIALDVANGASAENSDGKSRDNKVAVANSFSAALIADNLIYSGDEIGIAKSLLDGIAGTDTGVADAQGDLARTLSLMLTYADNDVLMQTNYGDIRLELFPVEAPITVANFLDYVDSEFYDGLVFHRVIEDFVIQGGGFDISLTYQTPNDPIVLETQAGLSNLRGTLAMARTSAPDTATSQFYINHDDNLFLDPSAGNDGYAVFGQVSEGMDVVDAIATVETTTIQAGQSVFQDIPAQPVLIDSVRRMPQTLSVRDLAVAVADDSLFVNTYFSSFTYGPSQQFYSFVDEAAVVSILIDNTSADFEPVVGVHLFADGTDADVLAKWINNQHSDALEVIPDPLINYSLNPDLVTVSVTSVSGSVTAPDGNDYEAYQLEVDVAELNIDNRFSLDAFTAAVDVQLRADP